MEHMPKYTSKVGGTNGEQHFLLHGRPAGYKATRLPSEKHELKPGTSWGWEGTISRKNVKV